MGRYKSPALSIWERTGDPAYEPTPKILGYRCLHCGCPKDDHLKSWVDPETGRRWPATCQACEEKDHDFEEDGDNPIIDDSDEDPRDEYDPSDPV